MFYALHMPRHPLMRLVATAVGALMLVALFTLGIFAFAALVMGGAIWLLVRSVWPARSIPPRGPRSAQQAAPDVIEGEFTVVAANSRQQDSRRT